MRKRWLLSFSLVVLVSILGLFYPETEGIFKVMDPNIELADVAWMLTATILVLLMTPGVSFFYGGMVRAKNVISTMLQSFIAMGVISIIWVVFGFSLTYGKDIGGIIGDPRTFFMFNNVGINTHFLAPTIPLALFALFQMKFAILTPALITGSFAERVRFSSYIIFMILYSIFVYAPLAHCTWHPNGLFKQMQVVDFAGGIVVHASSGIAALAGVLFLGKRNSQGQHRPANIPFVLLGTALLWIGWFGFNAGSALAADGVAIKAFLNTNTASAIAMLTWLFFDGLRGHKMSAMGAAVGAVAGLVGITPSAGYVTVGESIFIGFITAIVCNIAVYWKNKTSLDDALDVFPVHGVGGILGTILTGVFVDGLLDGKIKIFFNHIWAVMIVIVYTFIVTYVLYWITNKIVKMRVSPATEKIGLDISQHDEIYE
ncbi:MAG: ammonium transporter [Dysgonamonadaceae bacterium]|jgi:Amt family ammonium transporter|nr:ammonium transporter [Dysgonamonadaceae bacterium]MDD3308673.1 ammonium transporter [Dysgonamonadaceae bacterium]MDD3899735.1 ammonium transporter [Dysgonamonadaceae bacterium]MDD4397986.1 ammonium transporter [Dysgonamonadaceae bacterium]MEA5081645.1 ammonium transporter [Dysgonamonadaceae bacterium]